MKKPPPPSLTNAPASKVGRNEPCPCGSGKKYKRCCALRPPGEIVAWWTDDDMDQLEELTNQVPDLIREGRLDEAEKACHELKRRWPDMIDWRDRFGELHEARGEYTKAAEHYRLAAEHARTNDGFDDDSIRFHEGNAERCESKA